MTKEEIDETIDRWSKRGEPKWVVLRFRAILKNEEKVAEILSELEEICPICYDGNRDCQCWNDE